jgi:hypothetical protein
MIREVLLVRENKSGWESTPNPGSESLSASVMSQVGTWVMMMREDAGEEKEHIAYS